MGTDNARVPYRSTIAHAIGGGWGKDEPHVDSIPVRVIRGTDFKNIRDGSFELVPLRHEKTSKVNNRRLEAGDIILEISGGSRTSNQSTGRSLFITQAILNQLGDMVIPASFCRLMRLNRSLVDPRFVYFSLQHMYSAGRAALYEQQSTGISNFQFQFFLDEEILFLPPLAEQRAIAHILGTQDHKIELNRRMNETLEAMARALFKSWFVDFDPVRAKMAGRDTGLPPHLADLFPDRLVPSELGEIPEGWEAGGFGQLMQQRKEKLKDRKAFVLSAVARGELVMSDSYFVKRVYSKDISKYLVVEEWDVAYNPARINIGSIGMLKEPVIGAVSPVYVVARPKPEYRWFIDFLLKRPTTSNWINVLASGSVRQSLSFAAFASIPCVIPATEIQIAFDRFWTSLRKAILSKEDEAKTLSTLRDTLLPRFLSGDTRVPDTESFLERVL